MNDFVQIPFTASWRQSLIVIFTVALIIRIIFIFTLQDGFYFADAPIFSKAASYLVEHGKFPEEFDRAPLYPLFLAGVYATIGENIIIPRIVQAVLGASIAVLLAQIGRQAGGRGVGAIAGILWGIYPMGVFIAGVTYPTTLLALLLAGGVLCLLSDPGHKNYPAKVALGGVLFGLAALTKPIVLGTIVFMTLWILFWRKPGRILLASVFLVTAVATLTPWTIRNAYVYDRLVPIEARGLNDVKTFAEGPADAVDIEKRDPSLINYMVRRYPYEFISFFQLHPKRIKYLRQHIRDKAHKNESSIVQYTVFGSGLVTVVSIVSVGSIFTFALIGAWVMWKKIGKRPEFTLFVLMVMSFALGYALTYGKIRYRIPVEPYIIIFSSWGLMYLWSLLVRRKRVPG